MYDLMTKLRLRAYHRMKKVGSGSLNETITAGKVLEAEQSNQPYASYGTEVPTVVPGTRQHFKSFSLDLTAFVDQRDFYSLLLQMTHMASHLIDKGWGACVTDKDSESEGRLLGIIHM